MTTKAVTVGIATAGALGLAAFWWWSESREDVRPIEIASRNASVHPAAPAVPLDVPEDSGRELDSGKATGERAPSQEQGLRLLVVDPVTGATIPGTEIWHGAPDVLAWNADETDREVLLHALGRRATADAAGEAVLPPMREWLAVIGRAGERYGELLVSGEVEQPLRLGLLPDRSITIQVVDANGAPRSNVGVQIHTRKGSDESLRWTARTRDPDGTATLRHVYQRVEGLLTDGSQSLARIDAVLEVPAQADFDPFDPPSTPIRLVLPETGRIAVELVDEQGKPMANSFVWARPIPTGEAHDRELRLVPIQVHAEAGLGVLEHVELGLEVALEGACEHYRGVKATCSGPREVGEEVRVRMQFTQRYPVLTGRVLDEFGRALAKVHLGG